MVINYEDKLNEIGNKLYDELHGGERITEKERYIYNGLAAWWNYHNNGVVSNFKRGVK